MDGLKEWATALCAAAVLCCGAGLALPSGKHRKMMQTVLSLVMLSVLLAPAASLKGCRSDVERQLGKITSRDSRLLETVENQTSVLIESGLERLVRDELSRMNIFPQEIIVSTDINSQGCISIGHITVVTDNAGIARKNEIVQALKNCLGLDADVVAQEDVWS